MGRRKDIMTSPLLRKGHPHNIHEARAVRKIKEAKELAEIDQEYIKEEIEDYLNDTGAVDAGSNE